MKRFCNHLVVFAATLAVLASAGCGDVERMNDSKLTLDTPIGWWHDLQGGKIAEQRPPPPGVNDPYPNLDQVPPRPTLTDAAARQALTAQLAAERDRTRQGAAQDPLVVPTNMGAPPAAVVPGGIPPRPAAPPPDPGASVAVLDAATASPQAGPPPGAVPSFDPTSPPPEAASAPATAPLAGSRPRPAAPPPAGPSAFASSATPSPSPPGVVPPAGVEPAFNPSSAALPSAPFGAPPGEAAVGSGPLPALPALPPALPALSGIPANVNAPATARGPRPVVIAFAPRSAALPSSADAALRGLAGRRGGAVIAVTAGGDAAPGTEAQARALPLALRRARAIGDALVAAGVPAAFLRMDAAASGRGGEARLLQ